MKKRLFSILLGALFVLALAIPAMAGTPTVIVDGNTLTFEVPPTSENGVTFVPMKEVFKALGAKVTWDANTKSVNATKDDVTIQLFIGGKALKNNVEVDLETPAKIIEETTMVPLRFVSESLGAKIEWDGATQTITITSPAVEEPAVEEPAVEEPAVEEPAVEEPAVEEPAVEEPAAEEPAAEEPAADEPATDEKPVAETPLEEYLNELPYNTEVLAGVDAVFQIVIKGENEGKYIIKVKDGDMSWEKGTDSKATVNITTSESTWLKVAKGEMEAADAVSNGSVTATGDTVVFINIKDAFLKTE